MQEQRNGATLLKRVKRQAAETVERVESGLYQKVYDYRKEEIKKFYPDSNEIIAKNAALNLLEQQKEEDMMKYQKAKKFLERIEEEIEPIRKGETSTKKAS